MLAMNRCSRFAQKRSASLGAGSIRKVCVAVLLAAIASPKPLQTYCTLQCSEPRTQRGIRRIGFSVTARIDGKTVAELESGHGILACWPVVSVPGRRVEVSYSLHRGGKQAPREARSVPAARSQGQTCTSFSWTVRWGHNEAPAMPTPPFGSSRRTNRRRGSRAVRWRGLPSLSVVSQWTLSVTDSSRVVA